MFFIAFVGIGLSALTVAAFFGAWWWPLDIIANFRPQLGLALLVVGVWLVLAKWHRTARPVLAAAIVNLVMFGMLWVPILGASPADGERLRIVSFNVLAANERHDDVIAFLQQVDADVVFLHESSRPWEEAMVASDLGYRVEKTRDEANIFGTLVLVRPGAQIRSFGFTELEPRSVEVHLTTFEGTPVSILAVHPLSPVSERNAALRDAQLRFAANWANDQTGARVIVGDFNAGPWSHAFRELVAETGLYNSQRGFGLQASFPTSSNGFFRVPIDHLLASPELTVVDRRLGPALGSDHFPLIVDLEIGEIA